MHLQFDKRTGLFKERGRFLRVVLDNGSWKIYEIPIDEEQTWQQKPLSSRKVIFSTPSSFCGSARGAVERWLKA